MNASPRTISAVVESLRRTPPPGDVLSAYLDTSPSRQIKQAYLLAFRSARRQIVESLSGDALRSFELAADQAQRFLTGEFIPEGRGLALFTTAEPDSLVAVPLPTPPREALYWDRQPVIEPLVALLDDCERIAVLLFDKERARLWTIHLGEIESYQELLDDVPGKQATGGWFALAQSRYARHHEDHVLRHAKRAIATTMAALRSRSFDRLFIGGPDEARSTLLHHLPRPLRDRLAGTLDLSLDAPQSEVVRAALSAAEAAERQAELAQINELLDHATALRASLGVADTLGALNDGRVDHLLVADTFDQPGGECPSCGLLAIRQVRCPACGAELEEVQDLSERAIAAAVAQGAKVDRVGGEAAERLQQVGGLAAWTRY